MKIALIFIIIFLVASIAVFVFIELKNSYFKNRLKNKSNTLRIIIVDRKNNQVKYFDKTNISKINEKTFEEYIKSLPNPDAHKFTKWIDDLIANPDAVDHNLEVEIYIKSKNKIKQYSILEVKKIDQENKTVHIESHLFKFVAKSDKKALQKSSITKTELSNIFSNTVNLKGYTTVFKFATIHDKIVEEKIDRLVLLQLKEIILKYIDSPSKHLLELSQNEIGFFDMKINSSGAMIAQTKNIYQEMSTYIGISGLSEKIRISGGVIDNRLCTQGFNKHIEKAQETAKIALEQNEAYILYRKNLELQIGDKEIFRTEVTQIIKENKLKFLYMPILQLGKYKVSGYLTNIKPTNTFFANYSDVLEYARKTEDLADLVTFSFQNLIKNFDSKKDETLDDPKIYIESNMDDAKTILNVFNSEDVKTDSSIGLIFEEKNIDYYLKNKYEEMVGFLNEFKSKGFDVVLRLKDKEIIFSESVYGLFTSFIIDFSEFKEDRSTTPFRLKLRTIGEKLIKMEKPIIISEVNSWRNLETAVKSGFTFVNSRMIGGYSEEPLIIPSRFVKKIKEIVK